MSRAIIQPKTQEGFTLIEIMVVLVILGALAVISVPVYSNYVRRAKISEAITNVDAYATAIRIWKMENGTWPSKQNLTEGSSKVVDVNEKYFTIAWNGSTSSTSNLVINITADTKNFDTSGSFTYTMTPEYKGTWSDSQQTNGLLSLYAPYLLK
ncbi:MAG: prepilin-type N-terminal cleavage/methylation domain-containing protein [bacterium]